MPKKLVWTLLSPLFLSLLNCASIPDVYVFEHLAQRVTTDPVSGHMVLKPSPTCMKQIKEAECGHGVSIITRKQIFVGEDKAHWYDGKPWSQLRRESVYLPAQESYAPLSKALINFCAQSDCNDDVDKFRVIQGELTSITDVISQPVSGN